MLYVTKKPESFFARVNYTIWKHNRRKKKALRLALLFKMVVVKTCLPEYLISIKNTYEDWRWHCKSLFFFKFKLIYTNVLLVIRLSSKIFSTDKMQSFNYILHYIYLFILETFVPTTLKYLQYWIWDSSVYLL